MVIKVARRSRSSCKSCPKDAGRFRVFRGESITQSVEHDWRQRVFHPYSASSKVSKTLKAGVFRSFRGTETDSTVTSASSLLSCVLFPLLLPERPVNRNQMSMHRAMHRCENKRSISVLSSRIFVVKYYAVIKEHDVQFNFEKFVDTDKSFSARVTIRQKTGQFGFNTGAVNRFKIHDFQYGILYFDNSERVVGIELTNEKAPGTIEIKSGSTNTYIRAKNFCDKYSIKYSSSHSYELKRMESSPILFFEIQGEEIDAQKQEDMNEIAESDHVDIDDIF